METESRAEELYDQQMRLRLEWSNVVEERFSGRGASFLKIAVDGAFEHPSPGVDCRYLQESLWLTCDQKRLGELLGCSDRHVRNVLKDDLNAVRVEKHETLEQAVKRSPRAFLFILRSVPECDGPPREHTVYFIALSRLRAVQPFDPTNPIDAAILAAGGNPLFHIPDDSPAPTSEESTISGGSSGAISGGSSGATSAPSKTPAPVLPSCPAPQDSSSLSPDSCSGAQDAQEGVSLNFELQEGPCRRFDDIPPKHVRAIAGFSPGGKRISDLARVHVFLQYFRDAVKADFAKPEEVQLMLAIFRACGQRMSPDTAEAKRIRDPMNWIRSVWNARHQRPPLKNATIAKAMIYAGNLLKLAEETPTEPQLAEAT